MAKVSDWQKKRKIACHPSSTLSPQMVLARSLDKAPRMRGVAVAILWDDDNYSIDWSSMKLNEFVFLEKLFSRTVDAVIDEKE